MKDMRARAQRFHPVKESLVVNFYNKLIRPFLLFYFVIIKVCGNLRYHRLHNLRQTRSSTTKKSIPSHASPVISPALLQPRCIRLHTNKSMKDGIFSPVTSHLTLCMSLENYYQRPFVHNKQIIVDDCRINQCKCMNVILSYQ